MRQDESTSGDSTRAPADGAAARPAAGEQADLWHYLRVVQRRWWIAAAAAAVGLAIGWWSQSQRQPTYTSEVLLQVQRQDPMGFGFGSPVFDLRSHLDILQDRSVLGPVVDSLGTQLNLEADFRPVRTQLVGDVSVEHAIANRGYVLVRTGQEWVLRDGSGSELDRAGEGEFLEGPGFSFRLVGAPAEAEEIRFSVFNFDEAVERLFRALQIEQGSGVDVIRIRYAHPDPQATALVVNHVARSYQETRARSARDAMTRRRLVIAEQLLELTDSLRAVEQLVTTYQSGQGLIDPGAEGGVLMSALFQTENEVRELRFNEGVLESLVIGMQVGGDAGTVQRVVTSARDLVPGGEGLIQRLDNLQTEREELTGSQFGRTANDPDVQRVDAQIANVRRQIELAASQALALLRERLNAAETRYRQLRAEVGAMPSRSAEYSRLQQRVDAVQGAFNRLADKYYEAQIAESIEAGDVVLIAPAPVPVRPDPSQAGLAVGLSTIVGLLLGVLGTLIVDRLDPSVRRPADVERVAGLTVLSTIPNVTSGSHGTELALLGKEAFRTLRTHLMFAPIKTPKVIAVTSPTPRDGKSTVASNLALTLREQGGRVLLVDADMRRPQLHTTFGVERGKGLADVLNGTSKLEEVARPLEGHGGLTLLTAGSPVPNPTELIGSQAFADLFRDLRERFDRIVLDTPPLLAVTDAALAGVLADGTLLVVRSGRTDMQALESGVSSLRRLRVPIIGVVMNDVNARSESYRYSYYPSYEESGDRKDEVRRPILQARQSVQGDQEAS